MVVRKLPLPLSRILFDSVVVVFELNQNLLPDGGVLLADPHGLIPQLQNPPAPGLDHVDFAMRGGHGVTGTV